MEIKQYKLWKTEPSGKPDFILGSKKILTIETYSSIAILKIIAENTLKLLINATRFSFK